MKYVKWRMYLPETLQLQPRVVNASEIFILTCELDLTHLSFLPVRLPDLISRLFSIWSEACNPI